MIQHRPRRSQAALTAAAFVLLTMLFAGACGSEENDGSAEDDGTSATEQDTSTPLRSTKIRFALPADPLWQWLSDSGTLEAWEEEHGLEIETTHPYFPAAAMVSGRADVIVANAFDVPVLASELDQLPVIIGKYAADHSVLAVKRSSHAESLAELVDSRIALRGELGPTLVWALIAEFQYGLELRHGTSDFELVISTGGLADVVTSDEADACLCFPNESARALSSGELRPLYDGQTAAEIYSGLIGDTSPLPLGQVFVASHEWSASKPEAVDAFLALWEQAVQHWEWNYPAVIRQYPELLSVETESEIDWLTQHVIQHAWIAPTVYITEEEADFYLQSVSALMNSGHIPADATVPGVAGHAPAAGSES